MEQSENSESAEGQSIMCLGCSAIVPPEADFCPHCRAPLSSTSTTDPYKRIFAEGQMYWRLTHAPAKPIVIVGFILFFIPHTSLLLYAFSAEISAPNTFFGRYLMILGLTLYLAFLALFAMRTIQNFRKNRKSNHDGPDEAEPSGPE